MSRIIQQDPETKDWSGTTLKGEIITRNYYDWCGMDIVIQDIMDEQGVSETLATQWFWKRVREINPADFDQTAKDWGLENGIDEGAFDELRMEYLDTVFEAIPYE